jgi:hypothetical protein
MLPSYFESWVIRFAASLRYEKLDVGVCHAGLMIISIRPICATAEPCHSLEGVRKGEYRERRHEPVDIGLVCRADGIISRIWRVLDNGGCQPPQLRLGPAPVDHPLRGKVNKRDSTSTKPAWVIQFCSRNGALGSLAGCMLCM